MLNRFKGVVLKTKDYGESHQIVTIFSEFQGKLAVMARGAKKTKSRFGAVTEPFTHAEFICFFGSGIPNLSQADLIHSYHIVRSDLLLTAYGSYWLELVDKLMEEKEANPPLYRMLISALNKLEKGTDPDILTRVMELRMMRIAGIAPVLNGCAHCGNKESRPVRFSIRRGGFLCRECETQDLEAFSLTPAVIHLLPLLDQVPIDRLGKVSVKPDTKALLEQINRQFIHEHLSIDFKSAQVLNQIRKVWQSKA